MSTSAKSKSSRKAKAVDRPFKPEILKRAREIAEPYQVIVQFEDGEWYGRGLELPDAHEDGATPEECIRKTRDMFVSVVAFMLEEGQVPPAPASEGIRDQQVNIRLTTEEKLRLEETSKRAGFRGISDFIRARALS